MTKLSSLLKRLKNNSEGFTLIELLVVIAIIAILAGIVLVSLNSARVSARDTKRVSDMQSAQLALEVYYAKNGHYPAATAAATCENFSANLNTALGKTFDDPTTGQNYVYAVDSITNAQNYVVGATLEDTTNSALNSANDKDGTVLGCNCADPVYCLQP